MRPLRILQVSTRDVAGGAERSARNLADAFRAMGHEAWLGVGDRREHDPHTFAIPNEEHRNAAVRTVDAIRRVPQVHTVRGLGRLTSTVRKVAEPWRTLQIEMGREDFDFPATRHLLDLVPAPPDILHLHNLHGGYFDLRALTELSRRVPTVLNVRDGWLMSGHCAFSLGCEKWKTGCGDCCDLTLFPAIKRDATAFNWQRKRSILAGSRYFVATASEWMMSLVRESIVMGGAADIRVIPNGVDTATFTPGDRDAARARVGVDAGARVMLIAANGLRYNVWKDYQTLRAALEILGEHEWQVPAIVLAVGETAPPERIGAIELRFVPFQSDPAKLADYYRAADVYLHAARVESFGNVLLEARACGTPVVATATGGIPEQVRALEAPWLPPNVQAHDAAHASGVLVPQSDSRALAAAIRALLEDEPLRARIADNGLRHVQSEFTLALQAERFVDWYREILARQQAPESRDAAR